MSGVDIEMIRKMSVPERLDLMDVIWSSLDDERQRLPVPDWHLDIVRERLAELERGDAVNDEISLDDLARQMGRKV